MNLHGVDTSERLKVIAKAIKKHPDQFAMDWWFTTQLDNGRKPAGGCGTAACIGGWAKHIFVTKSKTLKETRATYCGDPFWTILGLNTSEGNRLMGLGNWPSQFQDKYRRLKSATARAKVAVARIEHFIATEGRE